MSKLRVAGTVFVVAVAGLGIWVAGTGMRSGRSGDVKSDAPDAAYDFQAKDVIVRQMGPDGSLQYEISAKQITQLPKNGQISAQDLVMHKDLPGGPAGGTNRWTLRADSADLPETGESITLKGKVHAEGRPQNSRGVIAVAADEIIYQMQKQEIDSKLPVQITQGNTRMEAKSLYLNLLTREIRTGPMKIKVDSANGISAPK